MIPPWADGIERFVMVFFGISHAAASKSLLGVKAGCLQVNHVEAHLYSIHVHSPV